MSDLATFTSSVTNPEEYPKPPDKRGFKVNLNPSLSSTKEEEIVREVKTLFYKAREHRRRMVQRWQKNYFMLRNKVNLDGLNTSAFGTIPEIFPIVCSMVGWMTDRRFESVVTPSTTLGTPYYSLISNIAKDLETLLESSFYTNVEENEITMMLWDSMTYGTGILKTTWDLSLAGGLGDAKSCRVDPFSFYPDPAGRSMDDCNYFVEPKTFSIQELDRRFPGAAKLFRAGGIIEPTDQAPSPDYQTVPKANPGAIPPAVVPRYGQTISSSDRVDRVHDEGITVLECWIREHTVFEISKIGPDGEEIKDLGVKEGWRVIVVAGNHVLLDAPAESIWGHGKHPYSRYVPYDLGEFWGISLVELLSPAQDTVNRLLNAIRRSIELTGNPIWIEDRRAQTQRTQLAEPGARLTKNTGSEVTWLNPPQISQDVPELLRYFLQRMEAVSGLSAITRGGTPQGRNAQGVIDAMQEAAFVRVRMALRNLEYTLQDAWQKKASLIVENYNTPRSVAIVGPQATSDILALQANHFFIPSERGSMPLNFQLRINAGSANHTSRKVREDKAITLFTLGAIDLLTLLEACEVPNAQQVLQRVAAMSQAGLYNPPGKRERARA